MVPYEVQEIGTDDYIGTVVETNFDTRELAVYLPKLMPKINIDMGTETLPTVLNGMDIRSNLLDKNITKRSSIWVKALDKNEPMPVEGSKVLVSFLEGDPENGFWEPFNVMDVDYEEDPDDKFEKEKLFTFNFTYVPNKNDGAEKTVSIDIHKGDNVTFKLNKVTKVTALRDENDRSNVNIDIVVGD